MKQIQIEPTTLSHLHDLMANIRWQDRNEVIASTGKEPSEIIMELSVGSRDTYTFLDRGYVLACVGVKPFTLAGATASPWMLGTSWVPAYPKQLLYYSKRLTDHWASEYQLLVNFVDARYNEAIRWAEKLGFTVYPAEPYGPNGVPFHRIERKG